MADNVALIAMPSLSLTQASNLGIFFVIIFSISFENSEITFSFVVWI